jgi:hypothetical protein
MTLLGRQKCHTRRRISDGKAPNKGKEDGDTGELGGLILLAFSVANMMIANDAQTMQRAESVRS